MAALDRFSCYHHIWRKDREDTMQKYDKLNGWYLYLTLWLLPLQTNDMFFYRFIQGSPLLSEFESQILFYRDLELEINSEPEYITVGALALFTGKIKKQFYAWTVTTCFRYL